MWYTNDMKPSEDAMALCQEAFDGTTTEMRCAIRRRICRPFSLSLSLTRRALESLHIRMCAYVQTVPLGGLTTQVMQ